MKRAFSRLNLLVLSIGFLFGCASQAEISALTSSSGAAESVSIAPMPKYDDSSLRDDVFPISQKIDGKDQGAYFLHSLQKKTDGGERYAEMDSDLIGSMLLLRESSFALYPVGRFLDQGQTQFGFVNPSLIPEDARPDLRVSSFGEIEISFQEDGESYLCSYRRDALLPMRYDCFYRRENIVFSPAFEGESALASHPWVQRKLADFSDARPTDTLMSPYGNVVFDPCKRLYLGQTGQFAYFYEGNRLHYLIPSAPVKDLYPSLDPNASYLRLCSADVTPSTERSPIPRTYQFNDHAEAIQENPVKNEGEKGLYALKQRSHKVSYASLNPASRSYETFYQEELKEDVLGVAVVKENLISIIRNGDTYTFEAAGYYENSKQFCPLVNVNSNSSLRFDKSASGITTIYLTLYSDDQGMPVSIDSMVWSYSRRKDEYVFDLSREFIALEGPVALVSPKSQQDKPSSLPNILYCDSHQDNPLKIIALDEAGKHHTLRLSLTDGLYESEDGLWAIRFLDNQKASMCSNRVLSHQTNLKMKTFYKEISVVDVVKAERGGNV